MRVEAADGETGSVNPLQNQQTLQRSEPVFCSVSKRAEMRQMFVFYKLQPLHFDSNHSCIISDAARQCFSFNLLLLSCVFQTALKVLIGWPRKD